MEKNHQDVSVEIVSILEKERLAKEAELRSQQERLLEVKRLARDLGTGGESKVLHPLVQRVVRINEELLQVQTHRLQNEASLTALRSAVQNGSDLRQHLINLEEVVGKDLVMSAIGITPESASLASQIERQAMLDRAKLENSANILDLHIQM